MIFHVSIPAKDPYRVARVIAELWQGEYLPFTMPGTFVVIGGDDRGSAIEVVHSFVEGVPGEGRMGLQQNDNPPLYSPVHLNIETRLPVERALAIAKREGWLARVCNRDDAFNVIEFWLENTFMLELMTQEELGRYRKTMNAAFWRDYAANLVRTYVPETFPLAAELSRREDEAAAGSEAPAMTEQGN